MDNQGGLFFNVYHQNALFETKGRGCPLGSNTEMTVMKGMTITSDLQYGDSVTGHRYQPLAIAV